MYTLLGDANLDGTVNSEDFTLFSENLSDAVVAGWDRGDFNYDGLVNSEDFTLLSDNLNLAVQIAAPGLTQATQAVAATGLTSVSGLNDVVGNLLGTRTVRKKPLRGGRS